MKQIYDLCGLCSIFGLPQCKNMHRLHPLKATIECEDFQPLFEYLYNLVEEQKEKVEDEHTN